MSGVSGQARQAKTDEYWEGWHGTAGLEALEGKLYPLVGFMSECRRFYGEGRVFRQETVSLIRFGMYNIRNDQNRGLESAMRGMSQVDMDLGVLQ